MEKTRKTSNPYRIVHITTVPKTFGQLTGQLKYFGNHGFEVYCISSRGNYLNIISQQENVQTFAVPMKRNISPLHDLIAFIRIFIILIKNVNLKTTRFYTGMIIIVSKPLENIKCDQHDPSGIIRML